MTQVAEKPSLDDIMAHYGKMGMHWGHRNASTGVRPIAKTLKDSKLGKASNANVERHNARQKAKAAKAKTKVSSSDIHQARARQEANLNKLNNASDNHALARTTKGKAATQKVIDKHWDAYLKDMKVANKSTRGEKAGLVALALIGGLSVAATMASASSSAQSGQRSYYNANTVRSTVVR